MSPITRHVPAGPGIVLIGHEGNYSVDNTGNRLGVRYNRKAVLDGGNQESPGPGRPRGADRRASVWKRSLASDGKFRFNGQDIEIFHQ